MKPENEHLKKGFSFSKGWFSGSMLVFGGVRGSVSLVTRAYSDCRLLLRSTVVWQLSTKYDESVLSAEIWIWRLFRTLQQNSSKKKKHTQHLAQILPRKNDPSEDSWNASFGCLFYSWDYGVSEFCWFFLHRGYHVSEAVEETKKVIQNAWFQPCKQEPPPKKSTPSKFHE